MEITIEDYSVCELRQLKKLIRKRKEEIEIKYIKSRTSEEPFEYPAETRDLEKIIGVIEKEIENRINSFIKVLKSSL